ncbi:MAG TPA: putative glycoside hydrolase [Candidatus Cloacimonadota bacterium]|nr:putative glycoside hydrolase [Candidatus Cloacimonadota bacterium]
MKKWLVVLMIMCAGILCGLWLNLHFKKKSEENMNPINKKQIVSEDKTPVKVRKATPDFTQALYVTAYTVSLKKFDQLLQKAKDSGINTIVFDVKEMQGYVYFPIKEDSTMKYLEQEKLWEIEHIINKIHSYDMLAVARVVQFFNIASARKYPNLLIKHTNGGYWSEKPGKLTWLDPSQPEVQNDLRALINKLGKTDVDEIQLDYVRFPTEGNLSNASFYYQRMDYEKAMKDTAYVKREKRHVIAEYLKSLRQICDQNNVRLTADIFAIVAWQRDIDIRNTGQDIAMMTPYLSHLHPMIYSSHFARNFNHRSDDIYNKPYAIVKEGLQLTKLKTHPNCSVIPYLQAFDWKVNYNKQYLFDQFQATTDAGCKGYILWNAGNNYDRTLDWVKEWNLTAPKQTEKDSLLSAK